MNVQNDEVMAVIAAAIAAYSANSNCKLVVRSLRRSGQTSPIWNMAGRTENISNVLF